MSENVHIRRGQMPVPRAGAGPRAPRTGADSVLALQRSIGNRAVRAILARQGDDVLETTRVGGPSRKWGYSQPDIGPARPRSDEVREKDVRDAERDLDEQWRDEMSMYEGQSYKEDYMRIVGLLADKDSTEEALWRLERRLAVELTNGKGALERALKYYEERFGFSTRQVIPLSVLSAAEFRGLYAQGVVPKDIGAGLSHGEMSHRLQWIAIMCAFERSPGDWNHTPLELLVSLDEKVFSAMQFTLMDKGGVEYRSGYKMPDNILRFMRDDAKTRERLPALSGEITRRWEKRQALAWEWAAKTGDSRVDVESRNRAFTSKYGEDKRDEKWQPSESGGMLVDRTAPAEATLEERLAQQRAQWRGGS